MASITRLVVARAAFLIGSRPKLLSTVQRLVLALKLQPIVDHMVSSIKNTELSTRNQLKSQFAKPHNYENLSNRAKEIFDIVYLQQEKKS